MPVHNSEISDMFEETADLLELEGANNFRIRAYRTAARTVQDLPLSCPEMIAQGEDLSRLPGIGKDLAHKIEEIGQTGTYPLLEELRSTVPPGLRKLLRIPQLGPKRIRALRAALGIETPEQLRSAAENGSIRELRGFGRKTETQLLKELDRLKGAEERIRLAVAEEIASTLLAYLESIPNIRRAVVAGSYRRRRETVGDLDVLITAQTGDTVLEDCVRFEEVSRVLAHGPTKVSMVLRSGIQVDIRLVPEESFGAALHYFTGSKAHNIAIRKMGMKRKLKVNEYGVFRGKKLIGGATEEDVYSNVNLPYIEPELREDRGEIQAAREGRLPRLITLEQIRGDLHCHTKETDGKDDLETMAEAARDRGYEYLAISDHSKRVAMARGLDTKRLRQQIRRIDRLNEKLTGIRLLKAVEVDILEDGSLDLPDAVLKELDLTVCSIHYQLTLPSQKQTDRILRAMDNPCFRILGHPTGRLINTRPGIAVDIERIIKAAAERGRFLEVNAQPDRLDLSDTHCKLAKEYGVRLAISTDAHRTTELGFMRFGVAQARRGWIEADDVINTRPLDALLKLLHSG